jgi:Quinohemoprotein amine dehydrogenase A, alpha subunit, haem binding
VRLEGTRRLRRRSGELFRVAYARLRQAPAQGSYDLVQSWIKRMEIGGMNTSIILLFGILGAGLVTLGAAAAQRLELPAGPNREIVSRECQACHDLSMVVAAIGLGLEGWDATIEEMTSYGMRVTPEERKKILDYLSNYLGSSSPPGPTAR